MINFVYLFLKCCFWDRKTKFSIPNFYKTILKKITIINNANISYINES